MLLVAARSGHYRICVQLDNSTRKYRNPGPNTSISLSFHRSIIQKVKDTTIVVFDRDRNSKMK